MGVISVRLDNDSEARLKREAQAHGLRFSDFLRERLTGDMQDTHGVGLEQIAERMDGTLRQMGDFLYQAQKAQSENDIFTQYLVFFSLQFLLPKDQRKGAWDVWHAAQKKTKEQTESGDESS